MPHPIKALLLCAGIGSRLSPLTDVLPKCLMPIIGKPLLSYWLEILTHAGVNEILINLHHHAEFVEKYIRGSQYSDLVTLVYEPELLGTGGTLLKNEAFFRNSPLLLAHADNLTLFDLSDFFQAHQKRPKAAEMTMMTFLSPTPEKCGIVRLNDEGIVNEFHEKVKTPPGSIANAAVYILEPEIIPFLHSLENEKIDFSTQVLPAYINRIYTYLNSRYHRDIGNFSSLMEAQIDFPLLLEMEKNSSWSIILNEENQKIPQKFQAKVAQILSTFNPGSD